MDPAPRPLAASPATAASSAAAPAPLAPPLQSPQTPEYQLTWALAHFQAEVTAIASPDLGAVAAAAKPVLSQGISWSAHLGDQHGRSRLQVTLRHAAGAELSSETWAPEASDLADTAGLLLAMLLGIPVSSQAQAVKPCDCEITTPVSEPAAAQAPLAPPLQAADHAPQHPPSGAVHAPGSGTAVPAADPGLEPLSPDEIGDCHRRILALPPNSRREFTNAFRGHFAVPRSARSIGDRINQRQHGLFLVHFLAEAQGQVQSPDQGQSQSQSQGQTQSENPAQPQVPAADALPLVP